MKVIASPNDEIKEKNGADIRTKFRNRTVPDESYKDVKIEAGTTL
ncbi:MAG TPA: hypothetical protein VF884_01610 [Nitrososphaeraceae archaeon]